MNARAALVILVACTGCFATPPAVPQGFSISALPQTIGVIASPGDFQVPPVSGTVDFGSKVAQVTPFDIVSRTTISLADTSGKVVGVSVTDPNGNFSLAFGGGFVPSSTQYYTLEAAKSVGGALGKPIIRLRTILHWAGAWESISSSGIILSRGTAAVAIIFSLRSQGARSLNQLLLMKSVQTKTPDNCGATDSYIGADTNLTTCTGGSGGSSGIPGNFNAVWNLVDTALAQDQDPVADIDHDPETFNFYLVAK